MRDRLSDLQRFYELMAELDAQVGGKRLLRDCHGRMDWPLRGAYFFFEHGEARLQSGGGPRVVRVGTHALKVGSRTTLWKRLSQHKGVARSGGGNHRGSIFRLIVGTALLNRDGLVSESWDDRQSTAPREIRLEEQRLAARCLSVMRFLPQSCRKRWKATQRDVSHPRQKCSASLSATHSIRRTGRTAQSAR